MLEPTKENYDKLVATRDIFSFNSVALINVAKEVRKLSFELGVLDPQLDTELTQLYENMDTVLHKMDAGLYALQKINPEC